MNKKEIKVWLNDLDRFSLFFSGILIGGVIELMGVDKLSIMISVVLLSIASIIGFILQKQEEKILQNEQRRKQT